jgi:hypothetical protein
MSISSWEVVVEDEVIKTFMEAATIITTTATTTTTMVLVK